MVSRTQAIAPVKKSPSKEPSGLSAALLKGARPQVRWLWFLTALALTLKLQFSERLGLGLNELKELSLAQSSPLSALSESLAQLASDTSQEALYRWPAIIASTFFPWLCWAIAPKLSISRKHHLIAWWFASFLLTPILLVGGLRAGNQWIVLFLYLLLGLSELKTEQEGPAMGIAQSRQPSAKKTKLKASSHRPNNNSSLAEKSEKSKSAPTWLLPGVAGLTAIFVLGQLALPLIAGLGALLVQSKDKSATPKQKSMSQVAAILLSLLVAGFAFSAKQERETLPLREAELLLLASYLVLVLAWLALIFKTFGKTLKPTEKRLYIAAIASLLATLGDLEQLLISGLAGAQIFSLLIVGRKLLPLQTEGAEVTQPMPWSYLALSSVGALLSLAALLSVYSPEQFEPKLSRFAIANELSTAPKELADIKNIASHFRTSAPNDVIIWRSFDQSVCLELNLIANQFGKDCFVTMDTRAALVPTGDHDLVWIGTSRDGTPFSAKQGEALSISRLSSARVNGTLRSLRFELWSLGTEFAETSIQADQL